MWSRRHARGYPGPLTAACLCICMSACLGLARGHESSQDDRESRLRPPRITEHPVSALVPRHDPVTLSCKADGDPEPSLSWTRNGELLEQDADSHSHSHRVLLPGGDLFFLRAESSDAGSYRCIASNSAGQAVSREATLEVAYMKHEFRGVPSSQVVAAGEAVVLHCAPPRGRPEPAVYWRRDGRRIDLAAERRLRLVDGSNLSIQGARPGDSGRYQCVAHNAAATRESQEAVLQVTVPPHLVAGPRDTTVLAGASVVLRCEVAGDPQPDVLWRRTGSPSNMPLGRVQVLNDRSLRITAVQLSDAGQYLCEADNKAGAVSASATLTVVSEPVMSPSPPRVVRLEPGGSARLTCGAKGAPQPLLTWALRGNRSMLLPGQRVGRLVVSRDADTGAAVATFENVTRSDSGRVLVCGAVNTAGAAVARTRLLVVPAYERPPPVILLGPGNQTLPEHSSATMPCRAAGRPPPTVFWYKDGARLDGPGQVSRVHISEAGTLHIDDLLPSDAGEYRCVAVSEAGEYAWTGWLRLSPEGSAPLRAAEPATLPGAPSVPRINGSDRHVTLSWQRNTKIGSSSLLGYRVEALARPNTQTQEARAVSRWKIIARLLPSTSYTYVDLNPSMSYSFLVRAENSHGLSPPSELAGPVVLGAGGSRRWMELPRETEWTINERDHDEDLSDVQDALENAPIVRLSQVVVISSTSVKVLWDVLDPHQVEGLSIYWQAENDDQLHTLTVLQSGPSSVGFLVTGLHCFTLYQFFLVPFTQQGEGRPSNSAQIRTLPDAPSAPPTHLEAILLNSSTALLKWAPPPASFQNGPLHSYQVVVQRGDPPELITNVTLSVDSALQLLLSNLSQQVAYHVSVAAATSAGRGPFSAPLTLRPNSPIGQHQRHGPADGGGAGGELLTETWFMALLGSMVAVMVLLFSTIILLHRRHQHRANKGTFLGIYDTEPSGPVLTTPLTLKAAEGAPHPLSAPLPPPLCLVPQDSYGSKYLGVAPPVPGRSDPNELVLPEYAEANDAQYDGSTCKSYYAEVRGAQPLSTFQSVALPRSDCCSEDTKSSDGGAAPYATTTLVGSARTPYSSNSTSWSQENERNSSRGRVTLSDSDSRSPLRSPQRVGVGHYDNFSCGSNPGSHSPLDHREAAMSFQTRCLASNPSTLSRERENRRLKLLRRQLTRADRAAGGPESSHLQLLLRSSPSSSSRTATPPDIVHLPHRQESSDYTTGSGSGSRRFGSSSSSGSSIKPSSVAYTGLRAFHPPSSHSRARADAGSLYCE